MNRVINENAVLKNIDTAPYVAFPALEGYPELVCGFSTRLGGVSRGIFAAMNLGFRRGDQEERVFENYRILCRSMGIAPEQIIFTDQVHKTVVRRASSADCGKGIFRERDYSGVDGHITNERGAALLVFGADCVPLFFYDPEKHAVGAAHAGWRGTADGIAAVTVGRMREEFGCEPSKLRVVIGPSIGADCYEVGADVAQAFAHAFGAAVWEGSGISEDGGFKENGCGGWEKRAVLTPLPQNGDAPKEKKYLLNLWEANRRVLLQAGVSAEHISVSGLCTMCRQDLFFSHRASGGRRGSMAGFIMLR